MNLSTKDFNHNYLKSKNYYNPDMVRKLDVIMKGWSDSRKRSRLNKYYYSFIKNRLFDMLEKVVNYQHSLKTCREN